MVTVITTINVNNIIIIIILIKFCSGPQSGPTLNCHYYFITISAS